MDEETIRNTSMKRFIGLDNVTRGKAQLVTNAGREGVTHQLVSTSETLSLEERRASQPDETPQEALAAVKNIVKQGRALARTPPPARPEYVLTAPQTGESIAEKQSRVLNEQRVKKLKTLSN